MKAEPAPPEVHLGTRSARATFELGVRLGEALEPGDVVALVGELGAGKTQLVRGICRGAGVPDAEVASPTFAIVATYHGRIPIHHADFYRLTGEEDLYGTGFSDLVGGEGAVLVEWADRIPGALPAERLEIALFHHGEAAGEGAGEGSPSWRRITARGFGDRHAALSLRLAPQRRAGRAGRKRGSASARRS